MKMYSDQQITKYITNKIKELEKEDEKNDRNSIIGMIEHEKSVFCRLELFKLYTNLKKMDDIEIDCYEKE